MHLEEYGFHFVKRTSLVTTPSHLTMSPPSWFQPLSSKDLITKYHMGLDLFYQQQLLVEIPLTWGEQILTLQVSDLSYKGFISALLSLEDLSPESKADMRRPILHTVLKYNSHHEEICNRINEELKCL